jgi:GR25 family glycosyltransferase involved in LPS biosynthesis
LGVGRNKRLRTLLSYRGFYINLDRSVERRAEIKAQLLQYGLQALYNRFPAADGNVIGFPNPHLTTGEIGCFTSHYLLLNQNIDCGLHLHVLEDDAVLSSLTGPMIRHVVSSEAMSKYDIIFTETVVRLRDYKRYRQLYQESTADRECTRFYIIDHYSAASS